MRGDLSSNRQVATGGDQSGAGGWTAPGCGRCRSMPRRGRRVTRNSPAEGSAEGSEISQTAPFDQISCALFYFFL